MMSDQNGASVRIEEYERTEERLDHGRLEAYFTYVTEANDEILRLQDKLAQAEQVVESCKSAIQASQERLDNLVNGDF
jgi:hypothetical protein